MYGLLLPEVTTATSDTSSKNRDFNFTSSERTTTSAEAGKTVIQSTDDKTPVNGIVRRRVKSQRGQRNRKSALHGTDLTFDSDATLDDLLNDMSVQLLSVSPEHKSGLAMEEGVVIESRTGKVMDLVKEFDDETRQESISPDLELEEGEEMRSGDAGRRKLNLKAFDMFEKSGVLIGMVS